MAGITLTNLIQLFLKMLMTGIVFLVLSIICSLMLIAIQKALEVKRDREHIVQLINRANFPSTFLLSVTSPESILRFGLSLNGVPLVPYRPVVEPEPEIAQAAVEQQPVSGQPQKAAPAPQGAQPAQKKPAINAGAAVQSGQAAAGKVGAVAGLLGTIGELLPGSLGSSLRNQSASLRETQGSALQAMQAPVNAGRDLESIKQQGGQMANIKAPAAGQPSAQPAQTQTPQAGTSSSPAAAVAARPSLHSRPVAKREVGPAEYTVQTQPLEPGAGYALVLKIGSQNRRYPEGTFAYSLKSLQQSVENLVGEPVPAVKQGVVNFPHVGAWRYWLAPALNVLIFTLLLFVCAFIFRIIWL